MNYKIVYRDDHTNDDIEACEDFDHHDDGERCPCDDCEDARRHPEAPDYDSLPLFRAMNYKP